MHLLEMHSKLLFIYLHVIVFKIKAALGKDKMSTCLEYHMTARQNITPLQTTCAPGEKVLLWRMVKQWYWSEGQVVSTATSCCCPLPPFTHLPTPSLLLVSPPLALTQWKESHCSLHIWVALSCLCSWLCQISFCIVFLLDFGACLFSVQALFSFSWCN